MKKNVIFLLVLVCLVFGLTSVGISQTKYDIITSTRGYKQDMQKVTTAVYKEPILFEYLYVLVNLDDLDRIAKSSSLDREKRIFLSKNKTDMLALVHFWLGNNMVSKSGRKIGDHEFVYITQVLKTHASGRSVTNRRTRPEEKAIEEGLFKEHFLYKLCLYVRSSDMKVVVELIDDLINLLYKNALAINK